MSPVLEWASSAKVSIDRSMIRVRSSGPQSATVHVVLSPVEFRVTLITVPLGAVRWAHVRSGALYHDATPCSVWVCLAVGLTGDAAGRATSGRPVVVVVRGAVVVVRGGAVVDGDAVDGDTVVAVAGAPAEIVVAGALVDVVVEVVVARTATAVVVVVVGRVPSAISTGSSTTRAGLTHVDGGIADAADAATPALTSKPAASPPDLMPPSTTAGSRRTDAYTPAAYRGRLSPASYLSVRRTPHPLLSGCEVET